MTTDTDLYHVECTVLMLGVCTSAITVAYGSLRRGRPQLALGRSLAVALALRFLTAVVITSIGSAGSSIRGTDDAAFLDWARRLGGLALTNIAWPRAVIGNLHLAVMSLQNAILGDPGTVALRTTETSIEVLGILLIAVAVHDAAGPRAAWIACWLAALEPTNLFFSTLMHKESYLVLGDGLALFGLVAIWMRGVTWRRLLVVGAGVLVVICARPYVGAFVLAAATGVIVHVGLRARVGRLRAMIVMIGLCGGLLLLGIGVVPHVAQNELLALQRSQDYVPTTNANLQLGKVDVLSSSGLAKTLANRTVALVVRPFPWQVSDLSQRLGAVGTLLWWTLIGTLAWLLLRAGPIRGRLAPFVYVAVGETVAFALTLNNAALGFRHRMHLELLAIAAVGIVSPGWRRERQGPAGAPLHD